MKLTINELAILDDMIRFFLNEATTNDEINTNRLTNLKYEEAIKRINLLIRFREKVLDATL